MPTIRLYSPTNIADAWHQVTSPGGYEWWYFDAEDRRTDTRIVAILLDGFVFHPGYLRRYLRYLRWPGHVLPPVATEFPCVYFVVYRNGRVLGQFLTQYAPGSLVASREQPVVTIGPNRIAPTAGAIELSVSGTPWKLSFRGPLLLCDQSLLGKFTFVPKLPHAPQERPFFSRRLTGAEHHWVIADPLCDVRGTITSGDETIEFAGLGYHDHNYGTAPIGPGLRRWIWGRVLLHDCACTFHWAQAADRSHADELHVVRADADSVRELAVAAPQAAWSHITRTLLRYPDALALGDILRLVNPRVVDSSPFYLRVTYDAELSGRPAPALCEIAYPHRLRWPILGRMIEMSIDKRHC